MRGRIDEAGSAAGSQRSVGRESGLTPRWTGNLWATWQLDPKWRVGIGADGMASRVPALAESGDATTGVVNRAPGYVKADALVEYNGGPYRLRLNLINLFDKVYADGIYRGFTVAGAGRGAQLTLTSIF
jgi:catecholate siderophore receptor